MRTHDWRTTHLEVISCLAVSYLLAVSALADEKLEPRRRQISQEGKLSIRRPQIESEMSAPNLFALRSAYKSASEKLEKDDSCAALFDSLDLTALEALGCNHYQLARSQPEKARCAPGVAAATGVGRSQIILCRYLNTLSRRAKIAILIHEALHTAGLSELPFDPDGQTSRDITEMVVDACSL